MDEAVSATDRGIGIAIVFSVLAGLSSVFLWVTAPAGSAAWGFAGAVTFGVLAVVTYHALFE
ncbi:MAG: hypothetical protein U5K37_01510 [Natrialbaceae archaeon]|nr:hypothetical protein [Natrialbaceae archaeon]